ncbi:alanine racemase [Nakamurella sp. PAMC28650]|uniref:alanine racemase n=1 Tax=Nakamurella sp. PAMC28650 TaxID=2762325 RepID=UPI00164D6F1B|nr:alanine racemase [Nakamurella sp. PAMC28650]QNK80599.1 amino acid deaminase [Nakamurella sp. PAMC28650]
MNSPAPRGEGGDRADRAADRALAEAVAGLSNEVLDWRFKAVPAIADGYTVAEFLQTGPRLSDFGTPLLTLDARALSANIVAMANWCRRHGLSLAPHGKTTMAPALYLDQLRAGAWGITVANEPQLRVARAFGVRRIHLANSLVRPAALRWLAQQQAQDRDFRFSSWVDSVGAVEQMTAGLPAGSSVDVCVELGVPGGRTGARGIQVALEVAEAVRRSPRLALVGVCGYEGAVAHGTDAEQLATVDRYLDDLAALHTAAWPMYDLSTAGTAMLTVGGSAYFDRVATRLGGFADPFGVRGPATEVVLRSGAYVAHDDGYYRSITPANRTDGPVLTSAMHGWARVVSQPEPGLALLDAGRRDLPFDQGLPEPQQRIRPDGTVTPLVGAVISRLNDQHAFLELGAPDDVEVGDVVRLGLSHPCTAFDKWTLIPTLEDADVRDPRVVGLIRTFF